MCDVLSTCADASPTHVDRTALVRMFTSLVWIGLALVRIYGFILRLCGYPSTCVDTFPSRADCLFYHVDISSACSDHLSTQVDLLVIFPS